MAKSFMNWKSTGSPHQLVVNNVLITKAFEVAITMNTFFYNKVQDIRKNIVTRIWTNEACKKVMQNKDCSLSLQFPSKYEILQILKNLSNSKCSAIDGLDNFSVKLAAEFIVDHCII